MNQELKNDLIASWNEVNEALTSLNDLSEDEIKECMPSIRNRLENAQNWLVLRLLRSLPLYLKGTSSWQLL